MEVERDELMVRLSCVKPEVLLPTCIFSTAQGERRKQGKDRPNSVSKEQQEVRGQRSEVRTEAEG